jgi:nucleoside-diphosphate-sugar epimerase
MTFLVTGASGFVGLNVVEHLLAAGQTVTALDRLPLPARARAHFATLPGKLHVVLGSVERPQDIEGAVAQAPPKYVIHCAVITAGAAREINDPQSIVAVNVQGAVTALIAAAKYGVSRFVYPSSGAVYGHAARAAACLDEDTLLPQPINLYGATKLAAEILLARIAESQRVSFVAARLGNVFGPWEYATGVRDTLSPMLQSLEHYQNNQTAVLSPAHTADYIYSRDVAAGLVRLAEAPTLPRSLYNLGSGRASTAAEWCALIAQKRPSFQWRPQIGDEFPNVITHALFDRPAMNTAHLTRDIGFTAQFTLELAVSDYLAFIEKT